MRKLFFSFALTAVALVLSIASASACPIGPTP
jgi:hypothetical protein